MATPANLPASFTDGNALPASQLNALRGAFRILQVVQGSTTTLTATTSTTYADTTLTGTITPQSSSSKILIFVTQPIYNTAALTDAACQVLRDATVLYQHGGVAYASNSATIGYWVTNYLDSPATTSAITYKTQFKRTGGAGTVYAQVNGNLSTIILCEVSA